MSTLTAQNSVDIRQRVCAIARTWLRTPYHHMGRVNGAGVDFAMFPLEVYREAQLLPAITISRFSQDFRRRIIFDGRKIEFRFGTENDG